ncbi:hypothetical protein TeGR_g8639 [Tetraparma gracilis]|uniref:Uncharacterized protein n=1 Tax=Tetraparma gracilis TaxID=2962635 RepID=A0ABQ6MCA0_9STRA|nr:hypothetical protein TeGR_g8639 [Tetraparma gracilis]
MTRFWSSLASLRQLIWSCSAPVTDATASAPWDGPGHADACRGLRVDTGADQCGLDEGCVDHDLNTLSGGAGQCFDQDLDNTDYYDMNNDDLPMDTADAGKRVDGNKNTGYNYCDIQSHLATPTMLAVVALLLLYIMASSSSSTLPPPRAAAAADDGRGFRYSSLPPVPNFPYIFFTSDQVKPAKLLRRPPPRTPTTSQPRTLGTTEKVTELPSVGRCHLFRVGRVGGANPQWVPLASLAVPIPLKNRKRIPALVQACYIHPGSGETSHKLYGEFELPAKEFCQSLVMEGLADVLAEYTDEGWDSVRCSVISSENSSECALFGYPLGTRTPGEVSPGSPSLLLSKHMDRHLLCMYVTGVLAVDLKFLLGLGGSFMVVSKHDQKNPNPNASLGGWRYVVEFHGGAEEAVIMAGGTNSFSGKWSSGAVPSNVTNGSLYHAAGSLEEGNERRTLVYTSRIHVNVGPGHSADKMEQLRSKIVDRAVVKFSKILSNVDTMTGFLGACTVQQKAAREEMGRRGWDEDDVMRHNGKNFDEVKMKHMTEFWALSKFPATGALGGIWGRNGAGRPTTVAEWGPIGSEARRLYSSDMYSHLRYAEHKRAFAAARHPDYTSKATYLAREERAAKGGGGNMGAIVVVAIIAAIVAYYFATQ